MSNKEFDQLVGMIEICCTKEEICSVFGMSKDTLSRRISERGEGNFAALYKKHEGKAHQSLRRLQWKAAQNGNVGMLIWLGKQWLHQRDKTEVSGPEGGPMQVVDPSKMSTAALEELQAAMSDEDATSE